MSELFFSVVLFFAVIFLKIKTHETQERMYTNICHTNTDTCQHFALLRKIIKKINVFRKR